MCKHKNYGMMFSFITQHGKHSHPSPSLYWFYLGTSLSSLLGIVLFEDKDYKVFFKKVFRSIRSSNENMILISMKNEKTKEIMTWASEITFTLTLVVETF